MESINDKEKKQNENKIQLGKEFQNDFDKRIIDQKKKEESLDNIINENIDYINDEIKKGALIDNLTNKDIEKFKNEIKEEEYMHNLIKNNIVDIITLLNDEEKRESNDLLGKKRKSL